MNAAPDPREGLARALANVHLDCMSAEHDEARLLSEGGDHMRQRFPSSMLNERPGDLDHWSWHMNAMQEASERGGIGEVPGLPFHPAGPDQING
jgi:hypothetical protein